MLCVRLTVRLRMEDDLKIDKQKVIALAEEAGLVFNTDLLRSKIFPWHRQALYRFAALLEEEIQKDSSILQKQ